MTTLENSSSAETSKTQNLNSQSGSGEKTESPAPGISSEGSQFLKHLQSELPDMVKDTLDQCLNDMGRNGLAALTRLWIDSIVSLDATTILAQEVLKAPETATVPALKEELEALVKVSRPMAIRLKENLARMLIRPETDAPPAETEKDPHEQGGIGAT